MPRIPDTDIDRIKRQIDLLALVRSRGVELKKHGTKDWIGRCPFHGDQGNPNFIVSPDKGLFHCPVAPTPRLRRQGHGSFGRGVGPKRTGIRGCRNQAVISCAAGSQRLGREVTG